ncbi:radical SAM peptide maturase [Parabacteroides goldsteinii]|jgi:possible regulatory protein|uniref:radical SAM peptide maturase n=1 Tax=Parabacteroides goldsteinii TaxID=328812 RepID=UPI002671C43A|nr:radical SAM peptide maturase [Parabacteroides goldsteinii]
MIDSTIFFKSEKGNSYLYDSNTKELLNIHPVVVMIHELNKQISKQELNKRIIAKYPLLQEDLDHYYKKYNCLKKVGFFKKRNLNNIFSGKIDEKVVENSFANCNDIVFQVTQQCNLKCKYCCYGDLYEQTGFTGDKVMDFSLAKKLIDYMATFWNSAKNVSYNNVVIVGFYGGEPLVNFKLINDIVDYLKHLDLKQQIEFRYSMTTNALLLDKYMDFIIDNNFLLLVSLDGNEIQDSLRVDLNDKPTFKRVFKNLKNLQKTHPRYFEEKVRFNSVLNSSSTAEEVFMFIKKEFGKTPSIQPISPLGIKSDKKQDFKKMFRSYEETDYMRDNTDDALLRDTRDVGYFFYYHLRNAYHHYAELLLNDKQNSKIPTGTCLPFMKKIFLSSSGDILVCERIRLNEVQGHVEDNVELDFFAVATRYNNLYKVIKKQCQKCYFAEFCSSCIFQLPYIDTKPVCNSLYTKQDLEKYLSGIVSFLEKNKNKFNITNKTVFA